MEPSREESPKDEAHWHNLGRTLRQFAIGNSAATLASLRGGGWMLTEPESGLYCLRPPIQQEEFVTTVELYAKKRKGKGSARLTGYGKQEKPDGERIDGFYIFDINGIETHNLGMVVGRLNPTNGSLRAAFIGQDGSIRDVSSKHESAPFNE